ncbi:hypothetical protein B484DRAFT_461920, partial [Ochromonadaceae sp. CCMP2298]
DGLRVVEADFDATEFGLSRHATRGDLKDLVARGGVQYDEIVEQLRLSRLANSNPAPAPAVAPVSQQTMIDSDMSNFHVTVERVNADGFKRFRDKCDGERRSQRVIDRNLLISADAQKLIGQLLATFKVPAFTSWKTWSDDTFFEAMAKIFPAGKTFQVKQLQDFLGKTRWQAGLRGTSTQFIDKVQKGFIDTVQKKAVATLMNHAKAGDTNAQPFSVRARLRARIRFSGKPVDIEDFIMKLLTEANFISEANYEMMACGMNYRPIGKVGDREG